jgi:hypothetical protein
MRSDKEGNPAVISAHEVCDKGDFVGRDNGLFAFFIA